VASNQFNARGVRAFAGRATLWLDRRRSRGTVPLPALVKGARLVPSPVFLFSSVRSGSTLLRVILDSHSDIHAPHEMHLGSLRVTVADWYGETAIKELGVRPRDLENLLWDRVLHLELSNAGKSILVEKTPYNTINWRRIAASWPNARYIFLKRHPLRIFQSLRASRPDVETANHYENVIRYSRALAQASAALPGTTVRYEDLTADPVRVVRHLCTWLDVQFQPGMLRYGEHQHGKFRRGLGDWSANINSGAILPAQPAPLPNEIPEELRKSCRVLGYL